MTDPKVDPFAAYESDDDPFAKYEKATPGQQATAREVFARPQFSVPGLERADLTGGVSRETPQVHVAPNRTPSDATRIRPRPATTPMIGRGAGPAVTPVAGSVLARETAAVRALDDARAGLNIPGTPFTAGQINTVANVLRAVPGGVAGGLTALTGTGGTRPANWLVNKAREVEGEPGLATDAGRLTGALGAGAALYGPLAGLASLAPEGTVLGRIGRGLTAESFGTRFGAQAAIGLPLDAAAAFSESRTTGEPIGDAFFRNVGYNLGGTALFEGAAQGVRALGKTGVRSADEAARDLSTLSDQPLAQEMPGVVDPSARVQRPASQLQTPGKPIYENPEPIAEARAANPLTDTDPAREGARIIEASQGPALPPEVYAGPERRVAIEPVSASDILNKHRRAADLPPTTAPLVPRVQTGTPRTGTVGGMQSVTRTEFPSARPPADETAVLERLAMQERSAASELEAQRLGAPPQMEGAAPILPMPGTRGRVRWEGGHKDFQYTTTEALQRKYLDTVDRASEGSASEMSGRRDWAREQGDGTIHSSGFGTMESGRGRAQINQAARMLTKIEDELRGRGVDVEALRAGEDGPVPLSAEATMAKQDAAMERSRIAKEKRAAKVAEAERLLVEGPDEGVVRAAGAEESPRMLASDPQVNVRLIPDEGLTDQLRLAEEALASPSASNPAMAAVVGKIRQDVEILKAERKARMAKHLDASQAHLAESESPSLANKRKKGKGKRGALGASGGPGFKSRLVEAAKVIKLEKAPAQTWISKLRGTASSADEFDWALGDALKADPKRVWTRAEIVKLAEERGYGALTETVRGANPEVPTHTIKPAPGGFRVTDPDGAHPVVFGEHELDLAREFRNQLDGTDIRELRQQSRAYEKSAKMLQARHDPEASRMFDMAAALEARADNVELGRGALAPKFASYQEPGGENYREVLLRVPAEPKVREQWRVTRSDGVSDGFFATEEQASARARAINGEVTAGPPYTTVGDFRSSHWDEPNVLAHIRMNDRVGPNGEKVLHVEEIQSDWHQKGRKEGYQTNRTDKALVAKMSADGGYWEVRTHDGDFVSNVYGTQFMDEQGAINEARRRMVEEPARTGQHGVPNAPFKETPEWMGLAMKRVLDEAVAGGYDAVSWTPGIKQADRYSLRKVADEVRYDPRRNTLRVLNHGDLVHEGTYDPKALPDVIGKEAADRLLATPEDASRPSLTVRRGRMGWEVWDNNKGRPVSSAYPNENLAQSYADALVSEHQGGHILRGEQLEIGGEGMQAFYDQMLPDWLRGYGKKLGVKIEVGEAPILKGEAGKARIDQDLFDESIHDIATGYGGRENVTENQGNLVDALVYFGEHHTDEALSTADFKARWEEAANSHDVRGRARAEGWRTIAGNLKSDDPMGLTPTFKITPELRAAIGKGQNYGKGATPVLTGLTGAGLGGAAGYATGDTPEERRRNAFLGAVLGLGVGVSAGALAERMGARGAKMSGSSPAARQVLSTIATDSRATTRPWLSLGERVKTHMQDETYPLTKLDRELGGGDDLRDLVSQSKGWRGMASQHLDDDLKPILESVKGIEGDVAAYAKAQRAVQLMDQGRPMEGGLTRDVYEQTIADLGQDPKVVAGAEALQGYYRDLLDLKHREGVLTDEAYQAILASEDFYTPFQHDIGDAPPTAGGGKWFNRGTGVKKMDRTAGTTGQTLDPYTMAVLHTASTYKAVAKQRVTNMVASLVEADPQAAAHVLRKVPQDYAGGEGRIVTANVHGKQARYEVLDPDLYHAWAAMDPAQHGIAVALMRPFKALQTAGVTALPDFMAANVIRDNAMTTIQKPIPWKSMAAGSAVGAGVGAATSEDKAKGALIGAGLGLGLGAVGPNLARSLGAMRSVLKNDDLYRQFLRDGGDSFGYYPRNTADAAKVLRQLQKDGVSATDIINPKRWWEGVQALGRAAEQGPRVRAYAEAKAAGASAASSIRAARDISVDFSTVGSKTKGLAAVTAFWNAGVQGWDKTARLLANPKTHAMAAATITAPSIALWMLNKDNQEYWDRPAYERNLFWLVPKQEGGFYRIPKPFEIGFVFGSVPERIMDFVYQQAESGDPEAAATLRRMLLDMASNTGGTIVPFPTLPRQIISQVAGKGGYDFFRERPIVRRPDVPTEEQYDEQTSSLAYGLGQATGASPQRVDFALRDLTGGGGRVALDATDLLARGTGMDTRPLPEGQRNPLLRRFTTNPNTMPDSERAIRDRAAHAEEIARGLKKVMAEGTPAAQQRYIQRHRKDLQITKRGVPHLSAELERVRDRVKELNYRRDQARNGGR